MGKTNKSTNITRNHPQRDTLIVGSTIVGMPPKSSAGNVNRVPQGQSMSSIRKVPCGNLQGVDDAAKTARVTVLLRPSERRSVFDRIVFRGSNVEREAKNFRVSRVDILQTLRLETRARLQEEREGGYIEGKRDSLARTCSVISIRPEPPNAPAPPMPIRRAS